MKRFFVIVILLSHVLFASDITVAVAANVSYAIKPLVKAFHQAHPKSHLNVIVGSSGKLFAQISHGAPYMLFMSADMKYPKRLYAHGMTTTKPMVYAQGALAIFSQKKHNPSIKIETLVNADIKKIAVANPKTAPYGVATKEALKNAKLYQTLKKKFVYAESIAQTLLYATSVADVGIVAKSSLFAPQMNKYHEAIHWSEIDKSLYTPIDQGIVILAKGKDNEEVKAFYDFMFSKKAKEILRAYGYEVP